MIKKGMHGFIQEVFKKSKDLPQAEQKILCLQPHNFQLCTKTKSFTTFSKNRILALGRVKRF